MRRGDLTLQHAAREQAAITTMVVAELMQLRGQNWQNAAVVEAAVRDANILDLKSFVEGKGERFVRRICAALERRWRVALMNELAIEFAPTRLPPLAFAPLAALMHEEIKEYSTRRLELWLSPRDAARLAAMRKPFTLTGSEHEEAMWCRDGVLHRDWQEGPAYVRHERGTGKIVSSKYCFEGKLHRPADCGPALEEADADGSGREFYLEGRLHRPVEHGPASAIELTEGPSWTIYAEDGLHHRPSKLGPACSYRDAATGAFSEEYVERGCVTRDPDEGPAIMRRDETGVVTEEYWRDGELIERREHAPC